MMRVVIARFHLQHAPGAQTTDLVMFWQYKGPPDRRWKEYVVTTYAHGDDVRNEHGQGYYHMDLVDATKQYIKMIEKDLSWAVAEDAFDANQE